MRSSAMCVITDSVQTPMGGGGGGGAGSWCQVNIGIPKYTHPGCLFSHKNRHPDAYIYMNIGIRVSTFTVNMGIPL